MHLAKASDPILRKKCRPVKHPGDFEDIAHEMDEFRRRWKGLGLAAPQVGIDRRFFVTSGRFCFNPKVLRSSEQCEVEDEGCLSLPNIIVGVPRPVWIEVEYTDETGMEHQETLWHLSARVFLHELDHLNGKLITDYL